MGNKIPWVERIFDSNLESAINAQLFKIKVKNVEVSHTNILYITF